MQIKPAIHKIIVVGAAVGAAFTIASVSFGGKESLPGVAFSEVTPFVQQVHDERHVEITNSQLLAEVDRPPKEEIEPDENSNNDKQTQLMDATEYHPPAWVQSSTSHSIADGCTQIYLDIGSNIGVQIRKLFEPEKYIRGTKTTRLFDAAFGPADHRRKPFQESGLCAFGFEANPKHVARLRKIEDAYNRQGWRLHFFVPRAVSDVDGNVVTLWSNRLSKTRLGASIFHKDKRFNGRPQNVTTFDITTWFKDNVQSRSLTQSSHVKPYVLAKMDIEGSEYPVLTRMMDEGLLCKGILDKMFIEWHHMIEAKGTEDIVLRRFEDRSRCSPGGKNTEVVSLDDESYQNDGMPLPGETTPPPSSRR